MPAITISRQLGSLGREIGIRVGEMLGYPVVWRELINQAARRAGQPEVALAMLDDLGLFGICPSPEACRSYRQAVKQVMEELINEGNAVIVGRAGQVILRDHPGVLHVRTIAPPEVRAGRVALQRGISLEGAQAQIAASDKNHRIYLRRCYRVRWDDPELYHMVINTGRVSTRLAAEWICSALEALQKSAPEDVFSSMESAIGSA